ncbi:hypothetical protein [Streptomyces sp. NPDC050287]|uniref:hypothetical protein n=1 Tax=Streptomyces sp. NPDC050287 TaxID=3365608 RepID=UPI0037913052
MTSAGFRHTAKHLMVEAGGGGLYLNVTPLDRRTTAEIADGLVPELQAQGLSRTRYDDPYRCGTPRVCSAGRRASSS